MAVITDRDSLRAAQAGLKERYRESPDAAATPVSAEASFSDPGVTATVASWAGPVRAGLHPATGGDGSDACSTDMLLQALVGCAGVTLRSVVTAYGVEVRSATVRAEGFFDARGTLGLDRNVEVGVQNVRVIAELDTDASDADLEKVARATERYCVVARSLATPPEFEIRRVGAEAEREVA